MFLKEFNQKGVKKIAKVNKMLKEEFGVSLKTAGFPKKAKLDSLLETANASINKIINHRNHRRHNICQRGRG